MPKSIFLVVSSVVLVLFASGSGATTRAPDAPIISGLIFASNSTLIGVSSLRLGENVYDVSFELGTCAEHFDGCDEPSDFALGTIDESIAALCELIELIGDSATAIEGYIEDGCDEPPCPNILFMHIPSGISSDNTTIEGSAAPYINNPAHGPGGWGLLPQACDDGEVFGGPVAGPGDDFGQVGPNVWAVFTPEPDPSIAALLSLGLIALGARARRRN